MDITYHLHKALETMEKERSETVDTESFIDYTTENDTGLDVADGNSVVSRDLDCDADMDCGTGLDCEADNACKIDAEKARQTNDADVQALLENSEYLTEDDETLVRGAAEIIKSLRVKAARAENDLELNYAKELSAAASYLEDRLKG